MQNKTKERIRNYIRENLSRGYSLKSIEKGLVVHGYESKFSKEMINEFDVRTHLNKNLLFVFAFLILAMGLFFVKPTFMGYITFTEQDNFTDVLSLGVNESSSYIWELENKGDLRRVGINARFSGDGYTKVYLRHDDTDYVVFDSSQEEGLAEVTGFAVLNETLEEQMNETSINETLANMSIEIKLDYYNLNH